MLGEQSAVVEYLVIYSLFMLKQDFTKEALSEELQGLQISLTNCTPC
jgi:hypothetical protein